MDPTLEVEPWQVEDYRNLPLDTIFERIEEKNIHLNKETFLVFAENVDTPEELTDEFLDDSSFDVKSQDQFYLLIFELWRRLLPEKPCLSVFCDELDYQIHLYDRGQLDNAEGIQDVLANLQVVLDENTDGGADPVEVFETLNAGCANDVESFLYDFIAEQIDNQNYPYATELLEGFNEYVKGVKWFDFLKARVLSVSDVEASNEIIDTLIRNSPKNPDLEFNLELLSFMVLGGKQSSFVDLVKKSAKLLETEQDFQDLMTVSADYYHCLDHDQMEKAIQSILHKRVHKHLEGDFDFNDPHFSEFFKILP